MHPAESFRTTDRDILLSRFRAEPFATVVAVGGGVPVLTHTPILVEDGVVEGGDLLFHVARSNRVAGALAESGRALVCTLGEHAYVSPAWYGVPDQVGTWNYLSAEAEGPVEVLDRERTLAFLHTLAATFDEAPAWRADGMSARVMERLLVGITAYRLRPERLEGTTKLSQNKPAELRERVADQLGDHPLGKLMRG